MNKKITGLTASGITHAEIVPAAIWRDSRGNAVNIESSQFNRVTYYREGYSEPCVMPLERFVKEFTEVKP